MIRPRLLRCRQRRTARGSYKIRDEKAPATSADPFFLGRPILYHNLGQVLKAHYCLWKILSGHLIYIQARDPVEVTLQISQERNWAYAVTARPCFVLRSLANFRNLPSSPTRR